MDIEETTESEHEEEEKMIISSIDSTSDLIGGDIDKEDTREVDNTQVSPQLLKDSSPCLELVSLHYLVLAK